MNNSLPNEVRIIGITIFTDVRGSLCAIESSKDIEFDIKRIFYVFGTKKNVSRGNHAHRSAKQLLVVLSGSLRINVEYNSRKEAFLLSSPKVGLYLPPMTWSVEIPLQDETIYLVLTSERYNESDYIHNYVEFIKAGDYT